MRMLRFGICLMVPPEHQRKLLNTVSKFVKAVIGLEKTLRHAKSVTVL
jgi:hypothetical protein